MFSRTPKGDKEVDLQKKYSEHYILFEEVYTKIHPLKSSESRDLIIALNIDQKLTASFAAYCNDRGINERLKNEQLRSEQLRSEQLKSEQLKKDEISEDLERRAKTAVHSLSATLQDDNDDDEYSLSSFSNLTLGQRPKTPGSRRGSLTNMGFTSLPFSSSPRASRTNTPPKFLEEDITSTFSLTDPTGELVTRRSQNSIFKFPRRGSNASDTK